MYRNSLWTRVLFVALINACLIAGALRALGREAAGSARSGSEDVVVDPLVSAQPILFVVRKQYKPDHHNTATMFQTGEINTKSFTGASAIKTISFKEGRRGEVKTLLRAPDGVIRDLEVHFSGEKILFSMRKNVEDDYHIYEMSADGSGLRQLTFSPGVTDIDPFYMPDGRIAFSSTREPKYCMCNRHIMANLFCMDRDGANIIQIGRSTLFEGHGSLLPDGRILYDRWEYVDRNFGDAQGLWTVNPDGTNPAVYWGNNTNSPGGVIDARAIPGTQQVVCVFGSCHDRPWGALAVIDRRLGVDGRAPVVRTWPADAADLVGKGNYDTFKQVRPRYEDPWPLSDKLILCSRMTGNGEEMGIYLLDALGNETLLHGEAPGCFDPMPLCPRQRPPRIPSRRGYFSSGTGTFYVADVYKGTHMAGVDRGAVKQLRVVESPEKRSWTHTQWGGQGVHCPCMNWHDFNNKRILGTVAVEEDGSACFEVPAGRFVYFQLLDENGMMIQSMRSGTLIQPGEVTGCVGCHEPRLVASPSVQRSAPLALQRPPSGLDGWHGPPRLFSYMEEVQPVFDKACAGCHDFGKEAGEKLVLAGDRGLFFNASYNELWRKKYINVIGAGPHPIQEPFSWGACASPVVEKILGGHNDVELSAEEFDRVVTWIDINAPYYPQYESAYPDNLAGRSPVGNSLIERLAELTQVSFFNLAAHNTNNGPQVCFDRPGLSPCLGRIADRKSPEYKEALRIIETGRTMLEKKPRADSPGFIPCILDRGRVEKYLSLREEERKSLDAVRTREKVYDR